MEGLQTLSTQTTWQKQAPLITLLFHWPHGVPGIEHQVIWLACLCLCFCCPLMDVVAVVVAAKEHLFLWPWPTPLLVPRGSHFWDCRSKPTRCVVQLSDLHNEHKMTCHSPRDHNSILSHLLVPFPLTETSKASTSMGLDPAGILISRCRQISFFGQTIRSKDDANEIPDVLATSAVPWTAT